MLSALLLVPAVILATQIYAGFRVRGMRVSFWAPLVTQILHWEWWALVGPFVWGLERRWPLVGAGRRRAWLYHVLAAPAVATGVLLLNMAAYHLLIRLPATSGWFGGFDRGIWLTFVIYFGTFFHLELLIYAGIIALAHASRANALARARERQALRLETELTGAKLTALRTQLQPHFLFNTLHTVGSLVMQRQNDRAVGLLAELGELLRDTLRHRDTDLTPLGDEIAYLERYLRIEEARFGDRLKVEWDIDASAAGAMIPPFIMQPLVENAFRHGISRRTDDSVLRISARRDNGSLRITVYNDGPPLPASFSFDNGGYGLKNVRERLRTRTPAGELRLVNEGNGVRADLELPLWDAAGGDT